MFILLTSLTKCSTMELYQGFMLVLYITTAELLLTVRRSLISPSVGSFYHSLDYFTNSDKNEIFCLERNAECTTRSDCTTCKCNFDNLFFSYQHGCTTFDEVKLLLNVQDCMYHTFDSKSIILTAQQYMFFVCRQLHVPESMNGYKNCRIETSSTVDIVTGIEVSIELALPLAIDSQDNCLKCKDYVCDLTDVPGMFLKLNILCTNSALNHTAKTWFMFRVFGSTATNESLPTVVTYKSTSPTTPATSTIMNTSTKTKTATTTKTPVTNMGTSTAATLTTIPPTKFLTFTATKYNSTVTTTATTILSTTTMKKSSSGMKSKRSKVDSGNHNVIIFAAVSGVVVILVSAIFVLYIRHRKKSSTKRQSNNNTTEDGNSGNNGPVYCELSLPPGFKNEEGVYSMSQLVENEKRRQSESSYYLSTETDSSHLKVKDQNNSMYSYYETQNENVYAAANEQMIEKTESSEPNYTYITPTASSSNPIYGQGDRADHVDEKNVVIRTSDSDQNDLMCVNEAYDING